MTSWPVAMVDGLAQRGLFVIQLDNRDVGLLHMGNHQAAQYLSATGALARRDGYNSQSAIAAAK